MLLRVAQRLSPRLLRRLARNSDGVSAIEFALVGPIVIALLVAILQTGIVFLYQQTLQTATTEAARLIMTGQAQSANYTASQFQEAVCANATSLFSCSSIYVNVQTFTSFSNVTMLNPIQNGKFVSSGMSYSPGGTGDIEVVQVFYQWPVYPGPLNFTLSDTSGNTYVLVATAAFRNEP